MKKQTASQKISRVLSRRALLATALLEGAAVVSVELLGAKMLMPLYGNSLVVWTCVLGVTIAALALGYLAGGKLTEKRDPAKTLAIALALGATMIVLMPTLSGVFFKWMIDASIYKGAVVSALLILGLPLFFLATTSPVTIQLLAGTGVQPNISGSSAGLVYTASTIGGILFTFVVGFFALPYAGVSVPVLVAAVCVLAFAFYIHYEKKFLVIAICFVVLAIKLLSDLRQPGAPNSKMLYESEGLLGQLKVVDMGDAQQNSSFRYLFINGIPQSVIVNSGTELKGTSGWPYIHKMAILSSLKKKDGRALLLGVGGGCIATELTKMKIKTDLVDLDGRMFDVARRYFYLKDSSAAFICDDARHYINTTKQAYGLIIMDVFNAEVQPAYMFTQEGFAAMKKIMSPGAILILQMGEQTQQEGISAYRSVCNTLLAEGFRVYCNFLDAEGITDALIVGSLQEVDFTKIKKEDINACCAAQAWCSDFTAHPVDKIEKPYVNGVILTDDKPMLDVLNAATIRTWREWAMNTFAAPEIRNKRRMFK